MNEFKKIKNNNETRYVLETMTAGATGASAIATAEKDIGEVQKRIPDTSKPRNFVVKNAKMGGAGKMKDKSKTIPRKEKHKKPVAEGVSDLSYDAQSLITKLRRDVEEKRLQPTAQAVLAAARELAGDMDFAPQLLVKQVLGQGVAEGLQARLAELKNKVKEAYGRYDRRDAYQRDYDHSVAGMDRGNNHRDDERHDLDPSDWYIVKDGKMYKTSVYPRQEQEALSRGYSRTREEAKAKAEQGVAEVAPPGWEKTVKAMKKHDNIDNPFALAWSMKNKGYKSHKKESADPYFESLRAKVEELAKK